MRNLVSAEVQAGDLTNDEPDLVHGRDAVEGRVDAGEERRVLEVLESAESVSGNAQAPEPREQQERGVHHVKCALGEVQVLELRPAELFDVSRTHARADVILGACFFIRPYGLLGIVPGVRVGFILRFLVIVLVVVTTCIVTV